MSETINDENAKHDTTIEGEIKSFENRWRYAVFPAMIAFVILSVFGFYLIYGMLQRMEALSTDVTRMTNILEKTMPAMSDDMQEMNETISKNLPEMKAGVEEMSISTHNIAATTGNMSNSVWEMNRSVSGPLSIVNKMMPFSSKTNLPRPTYTRPVELKVPKTVRHTSVPTASANQHQAVAPAARVAPATYQQQYQPYQPQNPAPVNNYQLRYF